IADGLVAAEREDGDFLRRIVGRSKKGETLDVIPVKVSERDKQLVLMMPDRGQVSAEISQAGSGIDDRDAICIFKCDLKTGGVTAELLKAGITDRDGAADAVKLKLHTE